MTTSLASPAASRAETAAEEIADELRMLAFSMERLDTRPTQKHVVQWVARLSDIAARATRSKATGTGGES